MSKMDIVEKEAAAKKTPEFRVGDTLKVHVRVKEGDKMFLAPEKRVSIW